MTSAVDSKPAIQPPDRGALVETGQRQCRSAVKKFFRGSLWIGQNLPSTERTGCHVLLHHLMRTLDMLDLESFDGSTLDVWQEVYDELSDALAGKAVSPDLIALAETVERFNVPRQFVFDPLLAADAWIRNRQHRTFEELEAFASRIGGSMLAATAIVAGVSKPDFETAAITAGKAMLMTQWLASCVSDAKAGRVFLATEDLESCEVDVHRLQMRQPGDPIKWLVRLYGSRIEKMFTAGGELLKHLDFDAARSFKSLLTMHWQLLNAMRIEPSLVLSDRSPLPAKSLAKLRLRHIMGLEGNASVIPIMDSHH